MDVTVRKATEKDLTAIFSLIRELAIFENGLDKVTNSVEQMKEEKDFFKCLVAENETGEIIGIALYFFAYYTWVGKSLYLDDLVVKRAFRGNGIGTTLMEKVFEVAKEEKCKRLRLQVLHWNSPAIELYKKNGFTVDKEWYNCDFNNL
jgi:diamine N-acetyltransferase